jgi:hypothetical protein
MTPETDELIDDPIEAKPLDKEGAPPVSLKYFLERVPPGNSAIVHDGLLRIERSTPVHHKFPPVDLDLYCETEGKCEGVRGFQKSDDQQALNFAKGACPVYIKFFCRNCGRSQKLYSLLIQFGGGGLFTFRKLAEVPDFGPPTPARVFKLIGAERDYYLKGRRSENQGAWYRSIRLLSSSR